jgi:hypothetical protein
MKSLGLPKTGQLTIHASSVIMVNPFITNELINRKCEAQKDECADEVLIKRLHGQSIVK